MPASASFSKHKITIPQVVDQIMRQGTFQTYEYGTPDMYESPIQYTDQPYQQTSQMFGVIAASKMYNCGGCYTEPTAMDKYWYFILSPGDGGWKNTIFDNGRKKNIKVGTSGYR